MKHLCYCFLIFKCYFPVNSPLRGYSLLDMSPITDAMHNDTQTSRPAVRMSMGNILGRSLVTSLELHVIDTLLYCKEAYALTVYHGFVRLN